jgi:hypothetical protein
MSFRVSALVAVIALCAGSVAPAFGQPQVPVRPRSGPFQNVFGGPGQMNAPGGQGGIFGGGPAAVGPVLGLNGQVGLGVGFPNQALAYPQVLPGALGVNPALTPTGVVGTFNNLGHWYPYGYNYAGGGLGHWYPNGIANGRGALGVGAGYGNQYGAGGGTTGGVPRPLAATLGTGLLAGGAVNQFRR